MAFQVGPAFRVGQIGVSVFPATPVVKLPLISPISVQTV